MDSSFVPSGHTPVIAASHCCAAGRPGAWPMALLAAAFYLPSMASALSAQGLIRGGYENGGDDIVTLSFEDGDTETLQAGGELFIEGGARLYWSARPLAFMIGGSRPSPPLPDEPRNPAAHATLADRLETELTLGYKRASITADNGDVQFDRFTVQALQLYRFGTVRLGIGVTWHHEPELDVNFEQGLAINGEDGAARRSINADSALGGVVVIDYSFDSRFHIGLRGTAIDYETDNGNSSGDSVGFYAGFAF